MDEKREEQVGRFGERVRLLRLRREMTQEMLAERIGVNGKSVISRIEKGQTELTASKITAIAAALDTSPQYLMGWIDNDSPAAFKGTKQPKNGISIPVLEGFFNAYTDGGEHIRSTMTFPKNLLDDSREYFAIKMPDDSMLKNGISKGDVLIFAFSKTASSGSVVCASCGVQNAVCRSYYRNGDEEILIAGDSAIAPVSAKEGTDISISGVLAYTLKQYK